MVSGDRDIIIHRIHQVDDRLAGCDRPKRLALDRVAVVYKKCKRALLFKRVPYGFQSYQAEILIYAAVDIAGKQDYNIPRAFKFRLLGNFFRRRRFCRLRNGKLIRRFRLYGVRRPKLSGIITDHLRAAARQTDHSAHRKCDKP